MSFGKTNDPQGRLIIVCGLPGSGKTTYAKALENDRGALRLCADDWMTALDVDLWDERTRERVEKLQWTLAQELLRRGQTVVIEWGTWSRSERDALRTSARALGAAVELHFLDVSVDELYARIQARSQEHPRVSLEHLNQWEREFQRPSAEEIALFDLAPS